MTLIVTASSVFLIIILQEWFTLITRNIVFMQSNYRSMSSQCYALPVRRRAVFYKLFIKHWIDLTHIFIGIATNILP